MVYFSAVSIELTRKACVYAISSDYLKNAQPPRARKALHVDRAQPERIFRFNKAKVGSILLLPGSARKNKVNSIIIRFNLACSLYI